MKLSRNPNPINGIALAIDTDNKIIINFRFSFCIYQIIERDINALFIHLALNLVCAVEELFPL